jgi:hypothetical protein
LSVNGIIQTPITDYTVSASSVTFTESYPSGSKINARYLVAATNSSDVNLANIVLTGTTTGDAYYPQVAALLHFDGTNGSTTITDNSKNNLTVTATNGAAISTAQSKFGGASALFDGTNDYLTTNTNANLALESENFTIEGWFYFIDGVNNSLRPVLGNYSAYSSNSIYFGKHNAYGGKMSLWLGNYSSNAALLADPTALTNNQWIHFAIVRNGSNWTMYRDGVSVATATYSGVTSTTNFFYIGTSGDGYYFQGYIDELRITKGIARYTGNFTPSTTAFSNTGGDVGKALVVNSTATGVSIGTAGYFSSQLAKAWVNFNGTGTVAIRDSYNVSSITDNGTGDYTVNYSTALNNSNYCALGSSRVVIGTRTSVVGFSNYTTTSIRLETINLTNNLQDEDTNCVSIFSN